MNGFVYREVLPGVWHIGDAMGVYMTLLAGEKRALLVDTGYGLEDVHALVRSLTHRPIDLILTHAHHDHALGAMHFERAAMFEHDFDAITVYTGIAQRRRVADQARAKGIVVPEDFLTRPMAQIDALAEGVIDLGGMTAQVILCPGHTPGSAVIYVPERKLLLTGDDWNPCTWLFFPEALGAEAYRENVRGLLSLPFECVLCSHREALYPRSTLEAFLSGLTDDALRSARRAHMGWPIDTREASPAPGQVFVFDFEKAALGGGEEHA